MGEITPEQQRIAIAEACGWTNIKKRTQEHVDFYSRAITHITGVSGYPNGWDTLNYLPDYCNDLNAMHEAEKHLDDEQWLEYMLNLQDVLCRNPDRSKWTVCRENMSATAHQRAEAFLRTLNLWTE